MGVVHLGRVLPGREVGIAPVREDEAPARPEEGLGTARDVVLGAVDVRLRALGEQRVVGRGVVGHEVEHQAHAVGGEARAQRGQGGGAAEVGRDLVARNGVRGPDDVAVGQVGQRAAIGHAQPGVGAGEADRGQARRPDSHQPHGIEAQGRDPLDLLRRNGVEGQAPTGARGQLAHPNPGVDLVEERVPGPAIRH